VVHEPLSGATMASSHSFHFPTNPGQGEDADNDGQQSPASEGNAVTRPMTDHAPLLLVGGRLADGTGSPLREADVLVENGRIRAVEAAGSLASPEYSVRDISGLVLAPGFIDVHSHADNAPLLGENDTTKILQGVTTEVVGNCGFSLAPRLPQHAATLAAFTGRIFPPLDFSWSSFRELLELTDSKGYVTNYCPLVGHGTLRIATMGMTDAPANDDQVVRMREELELGMEAGAFGLSSGLIYPPAMFSETGELVRLAEALGGDGLYATHMRGEGDGLLQAIREALQVGGTAGRTHISHLKSSGRQNWGRMPAALADIRAARASGRAVTHDVYPYTASSTMLAATLPPAFLAGTEEEVLARLTAPSGRAELARAIQTGLPGWENHVAGSGWDGILVSTTVSHQDEGRTVAEIAADNGVEPVTALVEVLVRERLQASMVLFSMREDDLELALADEHTMIGSDGLPPGTGGKPHPRLYGTFPRVLGRYTRERAVLDLPEAIRRMTSLAAEVFRIPERGVIAPGRIADLVTFDPATVTDVGDYRDPVHPPVGITWVAQAGKTVVEDGQLVGGRSGIRLTATS